MKLFLFTFFFCLISFFSFAQQQHKTIWATTHTGDIYTITPDSCGYRFICSANQPFVDIAFTPDGRLWGNTSDSLFRIDTTNGHTIPIGQIPSGSNALLGMNDSTLLIDAFQYLYAIKTTNASTRLIGYTGYFADGDITWLGKDLYMMSMGVLVKIVLNSNYTSIVGIDSTIIEHAIYTPGLTTAYIENLGYTLIALPGGDKIYKIDTALTAYQLKCTLPVLYTAFGASSFVFPPDPLPVSVRDVTAPEIQFNLYPNPAREQVYISLQNFAGNTSEITLSLYDYTGSLLSEQQLKTAKESIDMSKHRPGLYFVRLYQKGKYIGGQKMIKY